MDDSKTADRKTPRAPTILVPESFPWPDPPKRSRWGLIVTISVVVLTLGALGIFVARRFTSPGEDVESAPFVTDSAAVVTPPPPPPAAVATPAAQPVVDSTTVADTAPAKPVSPAPAAPVRAAPIKPKPVAVAPAPVKRTPAAVPKPAATKPAAAPPPAPAPAPAPAETGRLLLRSVPGGTVYVDDRLIGPAIEMAVPVSPGRHVVRVTKPGFRPYTRTVDVVTGEDHRLTDIVLQPEG